LNLINSVVSAGQLKTLAWPGPWWRQLLVMRNDTSQSENGSLTEQQKFTAQTELVDLVWSSQ